MPGRFQRLQLAALLLLVLLAGYCHAEVAEAECTAEGDCANVDAAVADDIPAETGSEPEAAEEAAPEESAAEPVIEEIPAEKAAEEAPEEDPQCPSRAYVIRCAGEYLDTNKNGKLERIELQTAIDSLPWYARGILQILGSVDKMMKKCDIDGDDAIGMGYDMENNGDQCLATCFKRKAFKSAFFSDCE